MGQKSIVIQGAREHNLKGVDVSIPRGSLTTITGVSGSGKSSLAFDTLHNEGQRRFLESLSAYARQFLGRIEKPDVDQIDGLSPTISIDQKSRNRNPRSTVGTITELYDHLRLLFARLGTPMCPECNLPILPLTVDEIRDRLLAEREGNSVVVLAPLIRDRKGSYRKELADLLLKGFVRARIDGELRRLDEEITLERYVRHTIDVVIDRIVVNEKKASRLAEALEVAMKMGGGIALVMDGDEIITCSTRAGCPECGYNLPEMEPRLFSFNSPHGACPTCDGLGVHRDVDPALLLGDTDLSISEGVLLPIAGGSVRAFGGLSSQTIRSVAAHYGIDLDQAWRDVSSEHQEIILHGSGDEAVPLKVDYQGKNWKLKSSKTEPIAGLVPGLRTVFKKSAPRHLEKYLAEIKCDHCDGARLRPEARHVFFRDASIADLVALPIVDLAAFFHACDLQGNEALIGGPILEEINSRLRFLNEVGLGYLGLERSAATLSGGESQRIRLATQVGSRLKGVLYILDEPSIGLHARDNIRLIGTLSELRDLGNTVCVVEHDQETMERSDIIIDVGPAAGVHGGEIVSAGTYPALLRSTGSETGAYLSGRKCIALPEVRREATDRALGVHGARHHNLKDVDVSFPLGLFTVVTGVSGSGKSSLIDGVLKQALRVALHGARDRAGDHDSLSGLEHIDKVIEIDQTPIGRTPRSNPATYSKVFDLIRDLFAATSESRTRGYKKGRFSFNVAGGRCEDCSGAGVNVVSMQFLPDVSVMCESCNGLRFNDATLEIRWRKQSINDILEMTVEDAAEFFVNHPKIHRTLAAMKDVGLGYVRLGQQATTLSGGEAQRLKLASELRRPATGRTLYLLDEPTTGLHFSDIEKLLGSLQRLVDAGNTVVVIEHNMDVIKVADWLIDLGPEGGAGGGRVVYQGAFDGIFAVKNSETAKALDLHLNPKPRKATRRAKVKDRGIEGRLEVRGARLHNLKGVDVSIPTGSLTVVTGPSGSGKTSLAFDTIFAEGQRRFVESLSAYARQFLGRLDKPPVDSIEGLAPAIAINQKSTSRNPRSTVATTTEIHDHLRLLFARVGHPHCPECGEELVGRDPGAVASALIEQFGKKKGHLLAPLIMKGRSSFSVLGRATELKDLRPELVEDGFLRVLVDGQEVRLDEKKLPALGRAREISLVLDRVSVNKRSRNRIIEAVEVAFGREPRIAGFRTTDGEEAWFTQDRRCLEHGFAVEDELHPRFFSFNSLSGSCSECTGVGTTQRCDPALLMHSGHKPVMKGAMKGKVGDFFKRRSYFRRALKSVLKLHGESLDTPFDELSPQAQETVLFGAAERVAMTVRRTKKGSSSTFNMNVAWPGLCGYVERWFQETSSDGFREKLSAVMRLNVCGACNGNRLSPLAQGVQVGGKGIADLSAMDVRTALEWFNNLTFSDREAEIASRPLKEIRARIGFLDTVGLGYLSLNRAAQTLSGGEAQRIRLASQIGSGLTGVIYVLDEPTIGLHQRDTERLLGTLEELKKLGNTIIVVEHDEETIERADHIIDLGPGAGHHGGEVVFEGNLKDLLREEDSITAAYMTGKKQFPRPEDRRTSSSHVKLEDVNTNNLHGVDLEFGLGTFTAVTGVSGSGKSSLVSSSLVPAMEKKLGRKPSAHGVWKKLSGATPLTDMVVIDQSPIGRTPKSNPATYTNVFDPIRTVFAMTQQARMKGFKPGRFSFNAKGGRCESCSGRGSVKVEMNFLADVWVECDVCRGRRYSSETLTVEYRGRTIADVLEMEAEEALEFFKNHARIQRILQTLVDVGLGYLKLGQASNTLSGGEAQRIKLARELSRRTKDRVLYVLDEPTTGLHFDDVRKLVGVLQRLVDKGHTVLVIEHNLDLVACADFVVDLGPEGGDAGGLVIATGTPEEVAQSPDSETGAFLKRKLSERTKQTKRAKKQPRKR